MHLHPITNHLYADYTFSPKQISGLKLWLDPTQGVTGTNPVSSWADQSGNLTPLTSSSGSVTGNSINGRASIDMSSGIFSHTSNISTIVSSSAWTAAAVFKYTGAVAEATNYFSNASIIGDFDNSLDGYWGLTASTTSFDVGQYDGAIKQTKTVITTSTNYYILCKYDGTKIYTSFNGGAFDAGTASGNIQFLTGSIRIGQDITTTKHFVGSFGDILVFNTALSDSNVASLNSYLKLKYGLI
jgi:hypothetical protein